MIKKSPMKTYMDKEIMKKQGKIPNLKQKIILEFIDKNKELYINN
jgi:hypothetical protein